MSSKKNHSAPHVVPSLENALKNLLERAIEAASKTLLWPRWAKRLFVILCDAILGLVAVWTAFALRLGEWSLFDWPLQRFALSMLILWYPIAFYQRIYRSIFRFTGRGALVSLTVAIGLLTVPLMIMYLAFSYPGVPRTVSILAPMTFLLFMASARIVGRYVLIDLFHAQSPNTDMRRVMIYGAGGSGQQLANSLNSERGMTLVGFIDDDPEKQGYRLNGVQIFSGEQIGDAMERFAVTDVMLAITNIGFERRREILRDLEPFGVNVRVLPAVRAVLDGRISAESTRPIEIGDLLGRPAVSPKQDLLRSSVSDRVVLVSGAGGSIGSELCRQVVQCAPTALVMVEANEFALFSIGNEIDEMLAEMGMTGTVATHRRLANVADPAAVARLFDEFSPATIYHAAAYKHVPLVEENVVAGVANNVQGTRLIAEAAVQAGTQRLILISTDKAVRPPNVMGATKRICEIILQDLSARIGAGGPIVSMVRFGNVLGSSGSVVPTFSRQITAGGPVTVTHRDVTRYFMTIPEAAQLVIQAGSLAKGGEVFLLDMGEPVKIWDLATSMIRLAGLSVRDEATGEGDIRITESGLRPGEKLYEELLLGDDALPTDHPRIMQARENCPGSAEVQEVLDALECAIGENDEVACRRALKRLVPTLREGAQHL